MNIGMELCTTRTVHGCKLQVEISLCDNFQAGLEEIMIGHVLHCAVHIAASAVYKCL